jgi:predicted RNase H-like HicB family nuclease
MGGCNTHGSTYEEAARKAREVLEMLVESHDPKVEGPFPAPKLFHYPGADVVNLPDDALVSREEPLSVAVQR